MSTDVGRGSCRGSAAGPHLPGPPLPPPPSPPHRERREKNKKHPVFVFFPSPGEVGREGAGEGPGVRVRGGAATEPVGVGEEPHSPGNPTRRCRVAVPSSSL